MSGLYVNTNVNSMTAANYLTNNMGNLSGVLTRLSTGLRINSAKDDPAGLIASEVLRSEITASTAALKNTQRANGMIAMADSALGQVGDLLNDIRGLVNEAANTGAMSEAQIQANQLQIDASLDAIDRIAQSTTYMGQKLLDGTMSFQTAGLNKNEISNLVINAANFGTQPYVGVDIDVQAASTSASQVFRQAALGSDGATFKVTGNQGSQVFNFGANATTTQMAEMINASSDSTGVMAYAGAEANAGQVIVTSAGADNDIIFTAANAGFDTGNYAIKYTAGNSDGISYTVTNPTAEGGCGVIEFQLKMDEWKNAGNAQIDESSLGIFTKAVDFNATAQLIFHSTTGSDVQKVNWVFDSTPAGTPTFVYDKNKSEVTITLNSTGTTIASVISEINAQSDKTGLTAAASAAGTVLNTAVTNYTTDLRANNALNIQALTGDTKYNNTDVVYINADAAGITQTEDALFKYVDQAQRSAVSFQNVGQYVEIKAVNAGAEYNGFTFNFMTGTTTDPLAVSYDKDNKVITVSNFASTNTLAELRDAVQSITDNNGNSLFTLSLYGEDPALNPNAAKDSDFQAAIAGGVHSVAGVKVITGQNANQVGTDHGALIVTVKDNTIDANAVITAFNTTADHDLKALFSISNAKDSDGSGLLFADVTTAVPAANAIVDSSPRIYSGALTGGQNGNITNTTAKELIHFVNNDADLSKLINVELAPNSQQGNGKLTLFDSVAYTGCPYDGTAIQFLGPQGANNIEFAVNGANQALSIEFTPDVLGPSTANLAAYNANAAFTITSKNNGTEFDDMAVRFTRVINNTVPSTVGSSVTYTSGPSNAMAYANLGGSLNDTAFGTGGFNGTFIFSALGGGDAYNNVSIQASLDKSQTEAVKFSYNENTKTFNISLNNDSISLADVIDAFQQDPVNSDLRSKFQFELDYSDTYRDFNNTNVYTGTTLVANDGSMTFKTILDSSNTATLGNTGSTGGHAGGVLEIAIYDDLYSIGPDGTNTLGAVGPGATITGVPPTAVSGDMNFVLGTVQLDGKQWAFQ
ncbi:MAG: flagellin, partial [Planctomycetaceae bacterium]|nr:flagellin [Planctomycetaceae bacterium]